MEKDKRKYCQRHDANRFGMPKGGFIHSTHGCLRCLSNNQTRNYVPAAEFEAKRLAKLAVKKAAA